MIARPGRSEPGEWGSTAALKSGATVIGAAVIE